MLELTHPVELRDEQLDLVAAGTGNGGGHTAAAAAAATTHKSDWSTSNTGNINVLNNISVLSAGVAQGVFN